MARPKPHEIKESTLRQWRLVKTFGDLVEDLVKASDLEGTSWAHPKRDLELSQYLSLFLFVLFNPVFETTRAICEATKFKRVQREFGGGSVSLGSFSEAQHLVDPVWLERLFKHLTKEIQGPRPKGPQEAWQQWFAQDSSVWAALPRMHWALYGGGRPPKSGSPSRAVRLHLSFHLLDDKPVCARVTPGKSCERKVWRQQWEKGATYVGDCYYGTDYNVFDELEHYGCNYILRLKDQAVVTVVEELPLSQADREANVVRQAWVRLGWQPKENRLHRVVWVQTPLAGILRLVTSLDPEECPAELIARMYRQRWQIEGFFKWLKVLLGCRHWLAESQDGVTLQLYLALIASVLFQSAFGEKPNKRSLELIQAHQLGWASDEELTAGIRRQLLKRAVSKKS